MEPGLVLPLNAEVHKGSLRHLAAAWAARLTGVVRSKACEPIPLLTGDATTSQSSGQLCAAICAPGLEFTASQVRNDGLVIPLGSLLVEAARLISDPRTIRQHARVYVFEGESFPRSRQQLPVPGMTLSVLSRVLRTGNTLEDALRSEGVGAGVVADDLSALVTLDFIRLERVSQHSDQSQGLQVANPSLKSIKSAPGLVAELRLAREWNLLENADDHTVLGLRAGSSYEQVTSSSSQRQQRYENLAKHQGLSSKARDTARVLNQRVKLAERRLVTEQSTHTPLAVASGLHAIRIGWHAIEVGDLPEAKRWFQRSRQHPGTAAEGLAGLGWVEVIDTTNTRLAREEGVALLRLAAALKPADTRVQWLLSKAIETVSEG